MTNILRHFFHWNLPIIPIHQLTLENKFSSFSRRVTCCHSRRLFKHCCLLFNHRLHSKFLFVSGNKLLTASKVTKGSTKFQRSIWKFIFQANFNRTFFSGRSGGRFFFSVLFFNELLNCDMIVNFCNINIKSSLRIIGTIFILEDAVIRTSWK